MTKHDMKLKRKFFDAVKNGIKTFEVRRADRDFKVGDTIHLTEIGDDDCYEGNPVPWRNVDVIITYILRHEDFPDGIPEGYCVLAIRKVDP